jgi:DNA-binding LytR/AlgR family response regulator
MKVHIEVDESIPEDEILIRCGRADESIRSICQLILEQGKTEQNITFYKENREYYFPLNNVLFFETEGEHVYAHTEDDAYLIKYRLYELEEMLPRSYVRVAKSTIVNSAKVYSVTRNITSASLIQFSGSHKQVYASRYYFNDLQQRLQERGQKL